MDDKAEAEPKTAIAKYYQIKFLQISSTKLIF